MGPYLGDYLEDDTIDFKWDTNDSSGASITRATDGTISVYKANGLTQSVAGITDTEDFDSLTGIHHCNIDLSSDAFYATGEDYQVVLSGATIDGQTVNAVLATFSIENRVAAALRTTVGTAGAGLTDLGGMSTGMKAEVESEANDALVAQKLDHLVAVADADDVVDNAIIAKLADNTFGTADWSNYSNNTESLKAIKARGDEAWRTGSGTYGAEAYTTTNWTRTVGDNDGGVGSDTQTVDGTYFSTGEIGTGTYLEVDGVFAIGTGEQALTLDLWCFYAGGGSHYIQVLAYNHGDSTWEPIGNISSGTVIQRQSFNLNPGHTNGTAVLIKLLHAGGSGVVAHVLSIDKAELTASIPVSNDANVTQWDGNAVTGDGDWAELQTDVDAILVDTADMQPKINVLGVTVNAMSITLSAVETDVTAIKAKTDNLPDGVKKNTALSNFMFLMVDSTDHTTPETGLTVTATRSIDGAAFGACANSVTEVSDGWYKIDLEATDLNGDIIALKFTASGADARNITIKTDE